MTQNDRHTDESIYKIIEENANDVIGVIDMKGVFQYTSPSHEKLLGFLPLHVGETFRVVHRGDMSIVRKAFEKIIKTKKPQTVEFRCSITDNQITWLEMEVTPVLNDSRQVYLIIMITRNITDRKFYEEQLRDMAFHDPLTGLPNRRLFKEHLSHALANAKRSKEKLAILYIDWHDFKGINDSMGHDTGDHYLKEFATRVGGCLREVDTFARMGGDEFVILLPFILSEENAERVVKRIYNVVKEPWQVSGYNFNIAIGMGISIFPDDGEDEESLLRNADVALYRSKSLGRNRYQFYSKTQ